MAGLSLYLEQAILNATLRGVSFTAPSSVYAALFTTDPTDLNVGTEVSGGAYVRRIITFDPPVSGVTQNILETIFPTATTPWGTITHIGLYDNITIGNLLWSGALSTTKQIDTGDVFKFAIAGLSVSIT